MSESHPASAKPLTLAGHALALGIYAVLTALYFSAYLVNPRGFDGAGDDGLFANAFWWFKKCLLEFKAPFFCDYLFFPDGMNLVFHTTTYSNFLLTLPLNSLFGVEVAVNMALLLAFLLSGYCCFLLAYELTGSLWGALAAGIIFSFSPFHFSQGRAHLHVSTLQWIPLYFLLLKRALEQDKTWLGLVAGAALGLIILTDQLQTICVALVTVGVLVAAARKNRGAWLRGARLLAVIGGTAAACASVYLLPLVRELVSHRAATKVLPLDHGGANTFCADLLGFFVPGFHRAWGGLFSSFHLGGDSVVYFGFITLALAGYGAWHCRGERTVRWLLVAAGCFWVMSLGTYLHINGVWQFGTMSIPLPYLAMTDIPLLGENRTPCRFHLMTLLAVAILAGYGVRELFARASWLSRKREAAALAALMALVLLETLPPRQEPGHAGIPALYRAIGKDPASYSVLQLPLSRWSALLRNGTGSPMPMMYAQTAHGKPIFGGLASRLPPEDLDFKDPILDLLVQVSAEDNLLQRDKRDPLPEEYQAARSRGLELAKYSGIFLDRYRIGYIVLHPPISGASMSRAFLEGFLGRELQADGSGLAFVKTK